LHQPDVLADGSMEALVDAGARLVIGYLKGWSMVPKSGNRLSKKDHAQTKR